MAPPPFTKAFIMFQVDEKGKLSHIVPYYQNKATYVGTSISMCLAMLRDSRVKTAFEKIAKDFYQKSSGSSRPNLSEYEVTNNFIDATHKRFPLIFIDDAMENPDLRGCTFRRVWSDKDGGFDTHNHAIVINGPVSQESLDLT